MRCVIHWMAKSLSSVERFDPSTGQWSPAPALPEPLWQASAALVGDRVWVAGGINGNSATGNQVYSAGSDGVWRTEDALPGPRRRQGAIS